MNLKKIAICLVLIVVYSVVCLNMHALASSSTTIGEFNVTFNSNKNNTNTANTNSGDTIEMVNGTTTGNNVTVNSANNTPGQLANTGLEDLPWLVVAIFGISAVYAYNKIREYKQF